MKRLSQIVILAVLNVILAGCAAATRNINTTELAAVNRSETLWVTTTDGAGLELKSPRMEGGKLVGIGANGQTQSIEPSRIASARVRSADGKESAVTAILLAGVGVGLLTFLLGGGCSS